MERVARMPVPQLVAVPKIVLLDGIQQRAGGQTEVQELDTGEEHLMLDSQHSTESRQVTYQDDT